MGSYQTKNEEVIIAQQGANNARQVGDMEKKIEAFGIVVVVIGIAVLFLCICLGGRQCCYSIRRWARNELTSLWSAGTAGAAVQPTAAPQTQQQVQTAYA